MSPGQKNWGNRTFLNMMEHAPLFLSSLWIHAVFVSADVAAALGAIYVCLRLCYPIVWMVFGGEAGAPMAPYTWFLFGKKINLFYFTFPQYGIVFYLSFATVLKIGFGIALNELVGAPIYVAPIGCGLFLYHFALGGFPFIQAAAAPFFKA